MRRCWVCGLLKGGGGVALRSWLRLHGSFGKHEVWNHTSLVVAALCLAERRGGNHRNAFVSCLLFQGYELGICIRLRDILCWLARTEGMHVH